MKKLVFCVWVVGASPLLFADRAIVPNASGDLAGDAWLDKTGGTKLAARTTYTLFETPGGTATPFTVAEFARMKAALPANGRSRLQKKDGKILLTLCPDLGLTIIVR